MQLKGFCAAPWVEGVLYNDGSLRACCRNGTVLGNWQKLGLKNAWHSEDYNAFRRSIHGGDFPDDTCRKCYHNGTASSLHSTLDAPFKFNFQVLLNYFKTELPEILQFLTQLELRKADFSTNNSLRNYFLALIRLRVHRGSYPKEVGLAIHQLETIGQITKAFFGGDLEPPIIAPFRQVQLIAKCNARCIQCTGLFTGEIISGSALDAKHTEEAFSHVNHIVNFFMNGSEFLVFKGWRKVAALLASNGTKISISTNGIRLTRENIRYLIDNNIILSLNISMDGAKKETIESIRVNVKFDQLIENIAYLFHYATEKNHNFDLSFSFVLMRRNASEFPQLIRLIKTLSGSNHLPSAHVTCQALENYPSVEKYFEFVNKEHHSLVDRKELVEIFEETLETSISAGVPVFVFYSHALADFVEAECPFPTPLSVKQIESK